MSKTPSEVDGRSPKQVLVGIQLLRGIAAILVVCHHAARKQIDNVGFEPILSFYKIGNRGVELFFVLSGFIIMFAHYRDPSGSVAAARYLRRRLTRVLPVTILVASATIMLDVVVKQQGSVDARQIASIWISSAFVLPMIATPVPIVIWTLRHELLFYLLFVLSYARRGIAIAAVAAWGVLALFVSAPEAREFEFTVASNLNVLFAFGLASYFLYRRDDRVLRTPAMPWIALAMFAALAAVTRGLSSQTSLIPLAYGPVCVLLLVSFARARMPAFVAAPALLFGNASFSIYMVHYPVVSAISRFGLRLPVHPDVLTGLAAACGVTAGMLFYAGVERPLLRSLTKRPARDRAVRTEPLQVGEAAAP